MVINVVLNLILIPAYGALGAAIGTTVTLIAYNVLKQVGLRAGTGVRLLVGDAVRPFVAVGVAGGGTASAPSGRQTSWRRERGARGARVRRGDRRDIPLAGRDADLSRILAAPRNPAAGGDRRARPLERAPAAKAREVGEEVRALRCRPRARAWARGLTIKTSRRVYDW